MWRRPIIPLNDDERDNHLFRIPDDPIRYPVLPDVFPSPKPMERSQSQPQMGTGLLGNTAGTDNPMAATGSPISVGQDNSLPVTVSVAPVATDFSGMLTSAQKAVPDMRQSVPMAS